MRRLLAASLLALLSTACASVNKASPAADAEAKKFLAPAGKANVYVFRDESFGGAVGLDVLLDGKLIGTTGAKTFVLATVEPGGHTLVSKGENDSVLEFSAAPGKNVYVWQEVKMGVWKARSLLQPVDEAAARPRIGECSLVLPLAPEGAAPAAPQAAAVPAS